MFESAEIGHQISKAAYREALPALRAALLEAQVDLDTNKKSPVVVLISGQDGAGKGETINMLYEWMDPRFISTLAFAEPTDEERERPAMWRYWRSLPPKGRVGIFAGSWYSDPIRQRVQGEIPMKDLDARRRPDQPLRAMLVNEGALVLKFWFHLTKDGQKKRLKALEKRPADRVARHPVELGPAQDLRPAAGGGRPLAAHDQHLVGAVGRGRRHR